MTLIATPFAEVPPEPEPVIALVREQLERECAEGRCPPDEGLDRLVEGAVLELWDAPIKTFVPLLALRRARPASAPQAAPLRWHPPLPIHGACLW